MPFVLRMTVATACLAAIGGSAQGQETPAAETAVARVGAYVERYFAAARTITARERVVLEPLDDRLRARGSRRTLVYDLRLEWSPEAGVIAPPRVHRLLVEVDGRAADDDPAAACLAPESRDPLAFLLPGAHEAHEFGPVRRIAADEQLLSFEYIPRDPGSPTLTWHGDCAVFDLPGLVRGRVVVNAATFAVRRLESWLVESVEIPVPRSQRRSGWGESITAERIDVRIAYEPVVFSDPDEVLLLPSAVERLTIVRTPDPRRLRVRQQFSDHRRFHTAIRILP